MTTTQTDSAAAELVPFHIVYTDNDQGPRMNVGICLNSAALDYIEQNKVDNPHLLVVLRQAGHDVERKLVPLSKGVIFVTFPRPGDYSVCAMVVHSDSSATDMKAVLLEKDSSNQYENRLFYDFLDNQAYDEFSGSVGSSRNSKLVTVKRIDHVEVQPVYVDRETYSKPPAKWRTWLARMLFPDNDRDQCHLRRRLLVYGLPMLLIVVPLHYLMKLIGLVGCMLLGLVYGLRPKHAWKAYRYGSFAMVFGGVKFNRSAWFYRRDQGNYPERAIPVQIGVVALGVLLVDLVVSSLASLVTGDSWWSKMSGMLLFEAGVFAVVAMFFGVIIVVDIIRDKRKNPKEEKKKQRTQTELERLKDDLMTMSCEDQGKPLTMEELRKRRRLAYVYHSTKDKVCKPFAR